MGVEGQRRPPLPAPTDSNIGTELDTEISRVTNKTSQTIPEDGTPVVFSTKKKSHHRDAEALTRGSHPSATSLLIEYFEGGKDKETENRKPSVRVKVTPSSKSRSRSRNEHVQITERSSARRPSRTQRIDLHAKGARVDGEGDTKSVSSYASATEESNVSRNVEIEVRPRSHSPLIPTRRANVKEVHQLGSDVSSMPADSFLDEKVRSPERKRSRSLTRGEALAAGAATGLATAAIAHASHTPSRRRSRSLSPERVETQKVVEKVRGDKSERRHRKHGSSSRSRSVSNSEKYTESVRSPRRRSSRGHAEESLLSGADASQVTGSRLSGDQRSFRSGTSKSSINNPKLLETVEDAIRRLILPELTLLKKEQNRDKHDRERRGSVTSGSTGVSRESREDVRTRKVSGKSSAPDVSGKPKVTVDGREFLSGETTRARKDRHDSPRSFERGASEETVVRDENRVRSKRSGDKKSGLAAVAAGIGLGALAGAAMQNHTKENTEEKEERRRRRRAKSRSRSDSLAESYEESEHHRIPPPMPMMSDINPSEVTRSSILSVDTERPASASAERLMTPVREVQRGYASPSSRTPTRTPTGRRDIAYGEVSPLSVRSQEAQLQEEYEPDEYGGKVRMHESRETAHAADSHEEEHHTDHSRALAAGALGAAAGAALGAAAVHHHDQQYDHEIGEDEDQYFSQMGEVPPPLRYVPYNAEKRGLSPIQSVSGYTEDETGGYHQPRNSGLTRSTGSYSTMDQSPQHQRSAKSVNSEQSPIRGNRHDFAEVRQGGLADSELTNDQDGEYWEEQHRENDRNRGLDGEGYRSSDPRIDYKHLTNYTDDSSESPYHEKVSAGQNVRGVGANPDFVHTPVAVESAVASLVSASIMTGHSGHSGLERQASYASYDEGSERNFMSRGHSPRKHDDQSRDLGYSDSERDYASQQNSPTKYPEYDLDDQGRKITMPDYKRNRDIAAAGVTGALAAATAAAIAGHYDGGKSPTSQHEERTEQTGAPLHKSFKDRAMDMQPRSPKHSIDKLITEDDGEEKINFTSNGIPDLNDPMPAIGYYGDTISEAGTNDSYISGPIGGKNQGADHWPNLATPPQPKLDTSTFNRGLDDPSGPKTAEAGLVGAAVGAVAATALASHDKDVVQDHDQQWKRTPEARTSEDRKRDTIITNPYEGTSPVTLLGGQQDRNLLGQLGYDGLNNGYATGSPNLLPKDEGYMSSAPNARSPGAATPEKRAKGVGFMDDVGMGVSPGMADDDPFYTTKHARQLSGMSHGMESPLYDAATGNGIDRIQSKDIVALMDHLTVRDAQRSARDTEILVTLVRAAAEMRNSFEDMKRLLADTEDVIITETQRNTDKSVQKVINGPRPLPTSASRSLRGSQDGTNGTIEDLPNKRRNVFRRALKGLSMRSSNDLAKIEDMLVQLLGEVEGLKVAQGMQGRDSQSDPYDSIQQEGAYEQDRGYEPEGNAGTSTASHASQSGHFSNPLSRGASASRGFEGRKFSENRISTVPEGDEDELNPEEQAILGAEFEDNQHLRTPTRENIRGGSVPLATPPLQHYAAPAALSNENTPKTDKSKKHKSSSSSGWNPIPKFSRWSETTASTVARGFRRSGRTESEQFERSPPSRSGSDLGNYNSPRHHPYGDYKLHNGFSQDEVGQSQFDGESPHLTSLLPQEDPKYKAHRNSLNLQHPQPRPGPTHRYQTALESQAQEFGSPLSPKSEEWGSSTSVNRLPPNANANRYSNQTNTTGQMSPVSDVADYSQHMHAGLAAAPVRPSKEPISSSPPAPDRPPKIRNRLTKPSPLSNEHLNVNNLDDDKRSNQGTMSPSANLDYQSPRLSSRVMSANLGVPARKPTGPRSMGERSRSGNTSAAEGSGGEGQGVRQRKRDTFGTIASNHSVESETF